MNKLIAFVLKMIMALSLIVGGHQSGSHDAITPAVHDNSVQAVSTEKTDFEAEADKNKIVGGWETAQEDGISQEAMDALNKALEGLAGVSYEPVRLLATQVVAGMNYAILCRATPVYPDAVPGYSIVYIYADLEGNAELVRTQDLISAGSGEVDGGWTALVTEEDAAAAATALNKAVETLVGASYETVTALAKQTVAGTNYRLLCKVTPAVPNAAGTYCLVTVYEDLDGQVALTAVEQLEYA